MEREHHGAVQGGRRLVAAGELRGLRVLVVDDDPDLRESVGRLLRSVGMNARLFASISDFLEFDLPDGPTCLVLDVRFPGQSGLDLQRELAAADRGLPIVFVTGFAESDQLEGACGADVPVLRKPFGIDDLSAMVASQLTRS